MAVVVTPDVIFNSAVDFNVKSGGSCRRVFRVDGLTPSSNIGFDAIGAVAGRGAPLYAQHPTAVHYFVQGYSTQPGGDASSPSQTSVWVTVIYETATSTPNFVLISMGGSNSQEILNRWPDGPLQGQPILVGYRPLPAGGTKLIFPTPIDPKQADSLKDNGVYLDTVELPIESHNRIVRFTRMEVASPFNNIGKFRQQVNRNPMWGLPARAVLCRDITAENIISGSLIAPGMYDVSYEFETSCYPWGFDHVEFFKDIQTGKPVPVDIFDNSNNGYTFIHKYGDGVDFSELKLPDPRTGTTNPST